jgi:hypothetical protein
MLLCQGTMLIWTRAKKHFGRRVSWTLASHAHWQRCMLHRLEPATLISMRWQDYVTLDLVMSIGRQMLSTTYNNDVTSLRRRAPTTSTTASRLHQQHHRIGQHRDNRGRHQQWLLHQRCHHIEEVSPGAIDNGSTSTLTKLSHREYKSRHHRGRLCIYANDIRHLALARHMTLAMWLS